MAVSALRSRSSGCVPVPGVTLIPMLAVTVSLVWLASNRAHRACSSWSAASGDPGGVGLGQVGEQQKELVAALAGEDVVGADRGAQPGRDLMEQRVAGAVPVGVVDGFEVVQVDEQQRGGNGSGPAPLEGGGEQVLQPGAVGQRSTPTTISGLDHLFRDDRSRRRRRQRPPSRVGEE